MGYTPYPNGDGEEENPSIAVSKDMYKWETPKNLANPIANNEETGCNELKDSQLIYRDDLDRLEWKNVKKKYHLWKGYQNLKRHFLDWSY